MRDTFDGGGFDGFLGNWERVRCFWIGTYLYIKNIHLRNHEVCQKIYRRH